MLFNIISIDELANATSSGKQDSIYCFRLVIAPHSYLLKVAEIPPSWMGL